jgi:hypothetical protein
MDRRTGGCCFAAAAYHGRKFISSDSELEGLLGLQHNRNALVAYLSWMSTSGRRLRLIWFGCN